MLKMFSTQLSGLFKRIIDKEEYSIEDAGRLLAQAVTGEGIIYIYGEKEMYGVVSESTQGLEPLPQVKIWDKTIEQFSPNDRFIIFSRYAHDIPSVSLAKKLKQENIPFVAISTVLENNSESLSSLADIHIDLALKNGLLPDDEGNRYGYPSSIVALFVYYGIRFTIEEIVKELHEEL